MKSRVLLILLLGFGALLILIGILGVGSIQRANEVYDQMIHAQQAFEEVDQVLRDLDADLLFAGILVRDHVLDLSPAAAAFDSEQLKLEQQKIERHLERLKALRSLQQDKVERLREEIQDFADSLDDSILARSPEEKTSREFDVIQATLIPKRQNIVDLAQELRALNVQNLAIERQAGERGRDSLRRFVQNLMFVCLGVGLAVAVISARRIVDVERRSRRERERAVEAERQQHRLAMRVVEVQEDERKRIALELHDAVGQMASALGMELGRLEGNSGSPREFHEKLVAVKQMNTEVIHAVKELASGLRPAMLDQLGLGPALRSHARQFEQRTGISTNVRLEGEFDSIPEPHRTCVYRIVQEALNNCGRHSRATQVTISLQGVDGRVKLAVQDNGVGFDPSQRSKTGLGLLGMSERVSDLKGTVEIRSKPGSGARLEVDLPIPEEVRE